MREQNESYLNYTTNIWALQWQETKGNKKNAYRKYWEGENAC